MMLRKLQEIQRILRQARTETWFVCRWLLVVLVAFAVYKKT